MRATTSTCIWPRFPFAECALYTRKREKREMQKQKESEANKENYGNAAGWSIMSAAVFV